MGYELGIVILCAVAVGSIWYLWIQVPSNRKARNREKLRRFMERQDEEIREATREVERRLMAAAQSQRRQERL